MPLHNLPGFVCFVGFSVFFNMFCYSQN